MIKSIETFLFESNYTKAVEEAGTIGRWVEKKISNNDYLKGVISPFLTSFSPDIRVANAVDKLSDFDKKQVFYLIAGDNLNESNGESKASGGKWIFKSFLKALTSLNLDKMQKVANKDYLIYYETVDIQDDLLLKAFHRFKSLLHIYSTALNQQCRAFYGLDNNLNFVYGLSTVSNKVIIGNFKLTKGNFEWLKGMSSMSFSNFKKDILELNWEDLLLLKKISKFMLEYPLGDKTKFEPVFINGVFIFSYYGVSKWDNGVIDNSEFINIKTNLKTRLSSESWSSRVLIKLSADDFYLKVNFKLK